MSDAVTEIAIGKEHLSHQDIHGFVPLAVGSMSGSIWLLKVVVAALMVVVKGSVFDRNELSMSSARLNAHHAS
ncbi:hypothetical protein ACFX14_021838 [Malus domestica]